MSERRPQPEALPAQVKPQAEVQIYPHSALALMPVVHQASASSPLSLGSQPSVTSLDSTVSHSTSPSLSSAEACLSVCLSSPSDKASELSPTVTHSHDMMEQSPSKDMAGGDFSQSPLPPPQCLSAESPQPHSGGTVTLSSCARRIPPLLPACLKAEEAGVTGTSQVPSTSSW